MTESVPMATGLAAHGRAPSGGSASKPGASTSSGISTTSAVPGVSGHVAALDGIRALAVVAVLLYHAGFGWAQGGFLGVDVFFVLSGYLITGLLVREYLDTGRISLSRFYLRRARRLLPALFAVVAGVCVLAVVWLPQEAAALRSDVGASLGYFTNWWFIARGQSYFGGLSRPSLVLHLWSLAVEEQFYLLWPLLMILMLRGKAAGGRAGALWRAVGWSVMLGLASAGMMVRLYSPWADPSRIYYGTDTRAFELLIGATLALVQAVRTIERADDRPPSAFATRLGELNDAVAGSTLAAVVLSVVFFRTTSPTLYPWGLIALCVVAAVLIQTAVTGGVIAGLLATRPLVWLGERSYGLYLWHWPVFDVTRPRVDVTWPGPVILLVRLVVSLALTEASYRWVEQPIRSGALGKIARRCRTGWNEQRPAFPASVAVSGLAALTAVVVLAAAVNVTAGRHPFQVETLAVDSAPAKNLLPAPMAGAAPGASASAPGQSPPAAPQPRADGLPTPPAKPLRVTIAGDSQGLALILNMPPDISEYLTVSDGTTMGCGILLGKISSRSGGQSDHDSACAFTIAEWAAAVRKNHPDVVLLVSGAWEIYDEQVGGVELQFGTPAWDDYYRSRLAYAVGQLRLSGAPQVDLALLPCWHPNPDLIPGFAAERGDTFRGKHINALLTAYAASAGPGVSTVDPPSEFCTDPEIASETSYRVDGVHYYKAGALLFFQKVIPQLFAKPH